MKILAVSSEAVPWAKTGGLADAMGALPMYLDRAGHDVRLVMPLYDRVDRASLRLELVVGPLDLSLGSHRYRVHILRDLDRPWAWLVECPALYHRGGIYTQADDEHRRFLLLSVAALTACQHTGFAPDIVHCNDWQGGMLPLLLRTRFGWDRLFHGARTLLTIHNLNYQGSFPASILPDLQIPGSEHLLHQDQLRQGRINFLLHGILYADAVNTVSPTYAREILRPGHGAGLDAFLRARASSVHGILNGVDYETWSPERDMLLPHRYSAENLEPKGWNKRDLLASMGLPHDPSVPVFGVVSRMVWQKGLDLVLEVVPRLLHERPAQFVILGSGEPALERGFEHLSARFPRHVAFYRGFSNPLAHRIEAGADLFVMPSRYEPCGLNQLYSLRYGTVPVVHRTGGLNDTVEMWNPAQRRGTGFLFDHHDAAGLRWALHRALDAWQDPDAWHTLMRNGMAMDYSWERQTRAYERLFEHLRS